tara:strand:+ start:262 stop:426 length:165 start_codon:yes stop_codon:yes gene_type:complete
MSISREEERVLINEFVKKNGVTLLPPDTRTEEDLAPKARAKKKRTLRSLKKKKK